MSTPDKLDRIIALLEFLLDYAPLSELKWREKFAQWLTSAKKPYLPANATEPARAEGEVMDDKLKQLVEKVESCNFECEAGPLELCVDWQTLKERLAAQPVEPTEHWYLTEPESTGQAIVGHNPNCPKCKEHAPAPSKPPATEPGKELVERADKFLKLFCPAMLGASVPEEAMWFRNMKDSLAAAFAKLQREAEARGLEKAAQVVEESDWDPGTQAMATHIRALIPSKPVLTLTEEQKEKQFDAWWRSTQFELGTSIGEIARTAWHAALLQATLAPVEKEQYDE